MGFNFRKSKDIGKGFRINMTQNGPGLSFGKKGARVTVNRRGVRGSVGIPGSGMSYSKQKTFSKGSKAKKAASIIIWAAFGIIVIYLILNTFV